ncbi:MAG TPA: ABC transporter permease [Anaerolineaceae bacterium]|nr:ABC transporter permease [Longilinea sp.]NMD32258.1 ABC transporter permease [Chloroflexota bacterium]HOU43012.1 ABC transporter permease [Anaerolineaceae bacterium]HPA31978.1 ABC transporter permease [Anaerolineaceae bacterium]HQF44505.1 ABC transporter permease [Anaerolineaceae bacterium]
MDNTLIIGLATILAAAAPILFAAIGETISERAGVINLSANGTILLSAMAGFAVAVSTNSVLLGFITGALIGGLVAFIVAFFSISLKQSQVAVGFILALLCRDLAYFLGNPIMGRSGPTVGYLPIPLLKEIPILGPIFFRQDIMTYLSYLLVIIAYIYIFKTRPGLMLQGIGERPAAAFVRGANVNRLRYIYTIVGGMLVGMAGPMYSLSVKAGWKGTISGLDGFGWIALAITIFGAWNPARVALGAYLFAFLQWLGLVLQPSLPGVPSQVLQVAPFPLMILTLLLVNIGNAEWVERVLASMPEKMRRVVARLLRAMRTSPPASLGVPFENE